VLRQLREWLDGGVSADAITVLAPGRFEKSIFASIDAGRLPRPIVDVSHADSTEPNTIRFSTVAGYKGLESEAVLLTGFENLDDPATLSLLYVGASRARAPLGLVLDEGCKDAYVSRAREVVERLVGSDATTPPTSLNY
jgi:hypothetical protein